MVTSHSAPLEWPRHKLNWRRYLRVIHFFGSVMLDLIWWELILRRLLGGKIVARGRRERLRCYARTFRRLAINMGGVMIKLGQFLSARLDVMPPEIIDELSGLQDEVPAEKLEPMLALIEAELGRPADDLFDAFDPQVRAAASLGQVYRARLKTGERVAIKVQRPGIEKLVATDLAALAVIARWAMYWSVIRKRANVPALLNEFARTLWEELDYYAEARNAERFQELFANDMRVYVPHIYQQYSSRRVLTMEDVTSIKITDYAAIEQAGVDRKVAAQRLLDIYLQMIFDFGFFHADPHPGNLFIYPLPEETANESVSQQAVYDGRPFYIVFVDFGMVGHISDQVKRNLRELMIAVATRDIKRLIKVYQDMDILLPGTDLNRIEQAVTEVFNHVWGKTVPEMARLSMAEKMEFATKYRDLMIAVPMQVPQDFIYLVRAVSILSGMCTGLDPAFNFWEPLSTYAQKLLTDQSQGNNLNFWLQEALSLGQSLISLPGKVQNLIETVQQGEVQTRITAAEEFRADLRRLEKAISSVGTGLIFASLLISSTLLYVSDERLPALIGYGLSTLALLIYLIRQ
mgnify:CR=1 FL=1